MDFLISAVAQFAIQICPWPSS